MSSVVLLLLALATGALCQSHTRGWYRSIELPKTDPKVIKALDIINTENVLKGFKVPRRLIDVVDARRNNNEYTMILDVAAGTMVERCYVFMAGLNEPNLVQSRATSCEPVRSLVTLSPVVYGVFRPIVNFHKRARTAKEEAERAFNEQSKFNNNFKAIKVEGASINETEADSPIYIVKLFGVLMRETLCNKGYSYSPTSCGFVVNGTMIRCNFVVPKLSWSRPIVTSNCKELFGYWNSL